MKKLVSVLSGIENEQVISAESHPEFFLLLQRGVLLALKERRILTATQYRQVEARLC